MEPLQPLPLPSTARPQAGGSDSLLGGLCREMARIHSRRQTIDAALAACQAAGLVKRLRQEIEDLASRQRELASVADAMKPIKSLDALAVAFFWEITRRSHWA